MFYFLFFLCFGFSLELNQPRPLFAVDSVVWYDVDFYENVFKEDWEGLSALKKQEAFEDFLSTELVCYLATKQGFNHSPDIKKSLDLRKKSLLINNTYEHLIARPLIKDEDFITNLKNLKNKAYIYHLLIGFKNSTQDTGSLLSKEGAFRLADSLRVEINKEIKEGFLAKEVFSRFALDFSIDPSAKTNKGALGWVPWGQTVMSFQKPAFELKENFISKPVLTEYGYHLILKTSSDISNYYYYTKKHYTDLAYKVSLNFLPIDSLRFFAAEFDSLLIQQSGLRFNPVQLDTLFSFIETKQKKEKLLGNKNVLINWLEGFSVKNILFFYNSKGFGELWLVNKLKETPSSRIPSIKTKKDIKDLILSFVLQDLVLSIAKEEKIDTTTSFIRDWSNNYKNIIYAEYLSFLNSKISLIDSSEVLEKYKKGLFENKYIKPKRAVFTEVRVFNDSLGKVLDNKIKKGFSFDSLVVQYGGAVREPVSSGAKSPLGRALFSLSLGEVSSLIKNSDGSFSVVRLESFLPEEPFTLKKIYSQLEQEKRKEKQDSVRKNLFNNLNKELSPVIYYNVLGLQYD